MSGPNVSSKFEEYNLSSPTLNISYYFWYGPTLYDRDTSQIFNASYLQENGICQDISKNTYRWGFSFLILFIFLALLLAWTTGTFIIYLTAVHALKNQDSKKTIGTYTGVHELSKAITQNFESIFLDAEELQNKQIQASIRKEPKGGTVPFSVPSPAQDYHLWQEFSIWFKNYKIFKSRTTWWISLFVSMLSLLILPIIWGNEFGTVLLSMSTFGSLMALLVGSTDRSRFLVFLTFLALGLITGAIVHER